MTNRQRRYKASWEQYITAGERLDVFKTVYGELSEDDQDVLDRQEKHFYAEAEKKYGKRPPHFGLDAMTELMACVGMWLKENDYD